MLKLRRLKHLADSIGFSEERLNKVAENASNYCEQLILLDPAKPKKPRPVLSVNGDLKVIQKRILDKIFKLKLSPSPHAHGGIPDRHIKTNIEIHKKSRFVFTADISNFYPTISYARVYRLFEKLDCTPDVARILTMLCTHDHHLALGLVTSPFIAEQIIKPIDKRIQAAASKASLIYTRYVDDIAISGNFDLESSGFEATVGKILETNGFEMHPDKCKFGRFSEGASITNLTLKNGHPDVKREYLQKLNHQLEDAAALSRGQKTEGLYYTKNQIAGKIQFVSWINHGRRRLLMTKFKSINWDAVSREAEKLGLIASKKVLMKSE
jgi:RNA-directed DNA polymerase